MSLPHQLWKQPPLLHQIRATGKQNRSVFLCSPTAGKAAHPTVPACLSRCQLSSLLTLVCSWGAEVSHKRHLEGLEEGRMEMMAVGNYS